MNADAPVHDQDPVDIMTQVTNDVTAARYAMSYSSYLPRHKCHKSDHTSSAVSQFVYSTHDCGAIKTHNC